MSTPSAKLIRKWVTEIEAVDKQRQKILDEALTQGFEPELIEVVVSCRKFEDEYKQAGINLPQEYLDAMKPEEPAPKVRTMTDKAAGVPYEEFMTNSGWTDELLIEHGYMEYV